MAHRRTILFRCMWFLIAFTAGTFVAAIPQIIPVRARFL